MADDNQQGMGGREMQAANLFDLRRIIGGLFVLYGVVLTIMGIGDSDAAIHKAAGININLWAGLGMLALGVLFLIWAFARPLGQQLAEAEAETRPEAASQERSGDAGHDLERTGGDRSARA